MNPHHERILKALTVLPLASTQQLAALNDSLNPQKKASRLLRELEKEKMVEWQWYGKLKLWKLSKKIGKKLREGRSRRIINIAHTLAIGDLYFTIPHIHFAFEPRFEYKKTYLEPDAMIYGERDGKKFLWCIEVQLTEISRARWKAKWEKYNEFFNKDHYKKASYQEWFNGKIVRPTRFIVLANQKEDIVKAGFDISGRDLVVNHRSIV